jgi:hypothetical protein
MIITNPAYDFIKRLVQVVLPALSSLYFGLAAIWNLPAAEQVVGTIAVFTTFLGVCLGISSSNYKSSGQAYDGEIVVMNNPDNTGKVFSLEVSGDPSDIEFKDEITFKVKSETDL